MSFAQARTDVVTAALAAQAAWVGPPTPLVVTFENTDTVDVDRQDDPYVCVEMHMIDGEQLSLGQVVTLEDLGQVHIVVHVPEGKGSLKARQILDHFRGYFELKTWTLVRTRAAMGAPSKPHKGWDCYPLIVPFYYHRLVTHS